MILVPAAMVLMGERTWWIPRSWNKIIPDVDIEGSKLDVSPSHA
jgi:putative drug exporter of the RND superfamily